jgi:hypothetical protein
MTTYPVMIEGPDGWTDWLPPDHERFKFACCHCDLVHRMQFRIIDGQVEFRVSRDMRATSAKRAHRRKREA